MKIRITVFNPKSLKYGVNNYFQTLTMLFTKSINEITYQDVVDFCSSGTPEGFTVEYKSAFPSNETIAKTIAAFGNTYGGVLIIGVNAPAGIPEAPFEGMDLDPQLKYEEKIESIVLSHIKEPLFPEIRVCDPVGTKTFIVIRVSESNLTPHRVSNNSKIYVRTGQSSTPNEEASWDKIEWIATRRKKSEELRELLLTEGDRYFEDVCKLKGINLADTHHYFATLSVKIIPLFPQKPMIPFKDLNHIENDITVRGHSTFPPHFYSTETVQNGVRKLFINSDKDNESPHGKTFEYVHLNTFGLYLYKKDVGDLRTDKVIQQDGTEKEVNTKRFNFYWISHTLHQFLASSVLFYKKLGYQGSLQVIVQLNGALGVRMTNPLSGYSGMFVEEHELRVPSNVLTWEKTTTAPFLAEGYREVAIEMVEAIAWSLGVRYFTPERIRKVFEDNFGN